MRLALRFALALAPCSCAQAQGAAYPIVGECPDQDPQAARAEPAAPEALGWPWESRAEPAPSSVETRNPFDSNWLAVEYSVDSRRDLRDLAFEGHSRPHERVDVYGSLDLYSSLANDPARFALRGGVFARLAPAAGVALWYEDFTGSRNSTTRLGAYLDPWTGGEQPFCRLELFPISDDGGGAMARAQFELALRERWSIGGYVERAWWEDGGDWTSARPELRYLLRDGVWATLEYRHDDRWNDEDGTAVGLRASL